MRLVSDSRFPLEAVTGDEYLIDYPRPSFVVPRIEEAALVTLRADAKAIALTVGLGVQAIRLCVGVMGDTAAIVVTHDDAAATDLLAVLRPRLVISAADAVRSAGGQLSAAAEACGAQLVRVEPGASVTLVTWLIRRAASIAFGRAPSLGDVQQRASLMALNDDSLSRDWP